MPREAIGRRDREQDAAEMERLQLQIQALPVYSGRDYCVVETTTRTLVSRSLGYGEARHRAMRLWFDHTRRGYRYAVLRIDAAEG